MDLPEVLAGKRQGFVVETRHHPVTPDVLVVPQVVPEPGPAGDTACRAMQFNRFDDGLWRDKARRIDQALGLEVTLLGQGHLRPVDGRSETHLVLQRPAGMQCGVEGRQDTAHAVADQRDVFHARVLLHSANTIGNEVEYVVLKLQPGKIKPGEVSNEMFSGMDWFPTLLAAAGDAEVLWAHPEYRTRSIPPAVGGRQGYRTHYFWTVQVTVSCIDLFVSTT